MELSTLKELREFARKAGIRGYSKLTKSELRQRLEKSKTARSSAPNRKTREKARAPQATRAAPKAKTPPAAAPEARAPAAAHTTIAVEERFSSVEEMVEGVKFATATTTAAYAADLGEDIDRMPALRQSTLCLLPQKPGVLHAYWALADGDSGQRDLKLRLCHGEPQALQVWDEVAIAARRGHWYFHVPETAESEVLIQLGYYDGDTFVTAIRRGIARIPSLYAAARTDRWWWISEEDFRRIYLHAGGALRGPRLGWSASIGSSPAPWRPEERLGWPGGVSSQWK